MAALLLAAGALAIPQHAAAQPFGGYADTLVFSVMPQDQAVAAVSSGEIDMYAFPLATAADKQVARDDPNISAVGAAGLSYNVLVNPVAPSDGTFNPFTIREIREAMLWAYDRDFIAAEIAGNFGIPMTTPYARTEAKYARDAAFFAALETYYSYDPARAKRQVDDAMSRVPGAAFDAATNKWLVYGNEIDVIIARRVEDVRFAIGDYVATEIAKLGFTPILYPISPFIWDQTKIYFEDAKLGRWHLYTEAWDTSRFPLFDDARAPFFFNGDFGTAIWDDYTPPSTLQIACESLRDGLYVTPEERRDLRRMCVAEGLRDGVRAFLLMDIEVFALNRALSNTVSAIDAGLWQPLAVRTTMKNGQPGGTLNIAQPVHTGSAWNLYGGFRDVYSRNQMYSVTDFGTVRHPHSDVMIPMRADFTVNSVGPLDARAVPTSALTFNTTTNAFVNVSPGVTSRAWVDFTMKWGEWHHGEMMTMDDVVAKIAMLSRMASGDLAAANPNNAAQIYLTRWDSSFRGFEVLDAETIRIYYDTYNPDETLIAGRADVFPSYPWELDVIMAESVLADETAFDATSAILTGTEPLDLAKGPTLSLFDPRLTAHSAANTIPPFLTDWVTSAEATGRWAALNEWRRPAAGGCIDGPFLWSCNYYVSQGPYYLDQYFTAPEGALYTAKRSGYPIEQDAWDFLGEIRIPRVVLGTPPIVIQTFPATFRFTTTLDGAPYDRIATAAWVVWSPTPKRILFDGVAVRSGPGTWEIEFTAPETTALFEGTYELQIIVVGEEAALPVVHTQSFNVISLFRAILSDSTGPSPWGEFRNTIDEAKAAAQSAVDVAREAATLANSALLVAIVAVVTAGIAVAALLVVWRRVR
ncbi:MAG: ABC transporter substrate-binding protein [Thermoplasmata archaeon]